MAKVLVKKLSQKPSKKKRQEVVIGWGEVIMDNHADSVPIEIVSVRDIKNLANKRDHRKRKRNQ